MKVFPDKDKAFPNPAIPSLCYIKNVVKNPRIIIGDYTYYDDIDGADKFEEHVTHFYDFIGDRLIIGNFCAIAKGYLHHERRQPPDGLRHNLSILYHGRRLGRRDRPVMDELPLKGDTVIGNDVWIGQNVTVMPGVHIGDGAIIGTNATVASDIPPFSVAVGNPARVIRRRFDDEMIHLLERLQWWNRPIEEIDRLIPMLSNPDIAQAKSEIEKYLQSQHPQS